MPGTYTIDGRVYREIDRSTIANDFYVMRQMRAAGLDAMKQTGETVDGFADRILSAVIENGVPFALLGGLLLPEGVADEQWTSNHAEATAARLAGATSREDKALIQKLIIQAITGFFAAGLLSSKPSLHALLPAEGDEMQPIGRNFYVTMENGAALSVN